MDRQLSHIVSLKNEIDNIKAIITQLKKKSDTITTKMHLIIKIVLALRHEVESLKNNSANIEKIKELESKIGKMESEIENIKVELSKINARLQEIEVAVDLDELKKTMNLIKSIDWSQFIKNQ